MGHTGSTPGGYASNRREEVALALCDRNASWPWPGGNWLRPLDYQFSLKARQNDAGIGKIDLLGVTDVGRLVVVELKVDGTGDSRSNPPPAALMEALRYAAIPQANQSIIASEAKAKFDALVSDEALPAIMLLGTEAWWPLSSFALLPNSSHRIGRRKERCAPSRAEQETMGTAV